jgi:hypothetical protein
MATAKQAAHRKRFAKAAKAGKIKKGTSLKRKSKTQG